MPEHPDHILVPALLLWTGPCLARSVLLIGDRERARDVFLKYCRILLRGPIEFYARWGMAFEPHLQNSMISIQDGVPNGLVLRDLDATILDPVRISQELAQNGLTLPAGNWGAMPSFASGGQRLIHALFYAHLSEVMMYFSNRVGVDLAALSDCVDQVWNEMLCSYSGETRDRIAELRANSGTVKRLLTMRMDRSMGLSFGSSRAVCVA